jgi:hypothetical protein
MSRTGRPREFDRDEALDMKNYSGCNPEHFALFRLPRGVITLEKFSISRRDAMRR